MGQHSSASASKLLSLDGFEVLAGEVVGGEWRLAVQTTAERVGCAGCGVRAEAHGRRTVWVRDLPAGGRPVVLAWRKRIWRCTELTTKWLRRRTHRSVAELEQSIRTWIDTWNSDPKPFVWTKTADQILDTIAHYCQRINASGH